MPASMPAAARRSLERIGHPPRRPAAVPVRGLAGQQGRGGQARDAPAVPREVGVVGKARAVRQVGQGGLAGSPGQGHEPLQPQHRTQRRRAVAEGDAAAPVQLALGQRRGRGQGGYIPGPPGQRAGDAPGQPIQVGPVQPAGNLGLQQAQPGSSDSLSVRRSASRAACRVPSRSGAATRRSRSCVTLTRNTSATTPGRNRIPTARVPAGSVIVQPCVSGPHTQTSPREVQSTSTQPSGTRACVPATVAVHPQTGWLASSGETSLGRYQLTGFTVVKRNGSQEKRTFNRCRERRFRRSCWPRWTGWPAAAWPRGCPTPVGSWDYASLSTRPVVTESVSASRQAAPIPRHRWRPGRPAGRPSPPAAPPARPAGARQVRHVRSRPRPGRRSRCAPAAR